MHKQQRSHNSTPNPPNQSLYEDRYPRYPHEYRRGEIYSTVTVVLWSTNHGAADSGEIQITISPFGDTEG